MTNKRTEHAEVLYIINDYIRVLPKQQKRYVKGFIVHLLGLGPVHAMIYVRLDADFSLAIIPV